MLLTDEMCHSASIVIESTAERLFDFVADPACLGIWAFGSWESKPFRADIYEGVSLFNGESSYSRLVAHPLAFQVDFSVGNTPDMLVTRVVIRILPGADIGIDLAHCLVTVLAWRSRDTEDERWRLTCASHEAEVFRLKYVFENELRPAA